MRGAISATSSPPGKMASPVSSGDRPRVLLHVRWASNNVPEPATSAQITEQTDLAGVDLVTVLQALSESGAAGDRARARL